MPYIKKKDRFKIVQGGTDYDRPSVIHYETIENSGELQYAIAIMIKNFMERKGLKYQNCNDVMGALAGAQMEFYRRTVAPYEDLKLKENGDV